MVGIDQGKDESLVHYHKCFTAYVKVTEAKWGTFYPPDMAGSTTTSKQQSRDQLLACIFLAGVDRHQYECIRDDLNNSYLAGKDNYPKSVDTALTMLTHYQDHRSHLKVADSSDDKLKSKDSVGKPDIYPCT